ncbi:phage tail protein [Luteolibacter soli]|uniref:Tail fiber protein n=1 Tax=Luteolibacter soli TaxID=3135280 RepID=A0ABU9AVM6_9BACT
MNRLLPRHSRTGLPAHRLASRFAAAALLLGVASLHAADITAVTGSSSPMDTVQPGLVVRSQFVMTGVYPTPGDGLPGLPPNDGYLGEIHFSAGDIAIGDPEADGRLIPVTGNTAVYSILFTRYGGNGVQNFALPDLRGTVPVQPGQGSGLTAVTLAGKSGSEKVALVAENLPRHGHTLHTLQLNFTGEVATSPFENRQSSLGLNFLINGAGELRLFAGDFAPSGWALAQGQLLSIDEYPDLYAALGTAWGGDGVSTFALPDLRGRVPVGAGQGPGLTSRTLGQTFGSETTVLSGLNLPAHTHGYGGASTSSSGTSTPIDTVQPSAAIQIGIVTLGLFPQVGHNGYNGHTLGEIVMYAGALPADVTPADGRTLPINSNNALHQVVGDVYGGNGQTTFGLPDFRGRTPMGRGTGSGLTARALAEKVGVETHVVTPAEMPAHQHVIPETMVIPNASFEADFYGNWPGYASNNNNGRITGWSWSGQVGINPVRDPSPSYPFADNGAIPAGSQVAIVQSQNGNEGSMVTTVAGLTPGTRYTVSFRANARDYLGSVPAATWSLECGANSPAKPAVPFNVSPRVGGTNPYYRVTGTFIATSSLLDIRLRNQTSVDSTVLLDDFKLTAEDFSSPWRIRPWNDDASSGVGTGQFFNTESWAYALGTPVGGLDLNGVRVGGLPSSNLNAPGKVKIEGADFGGVFQSGSQSTVPGNSGGASGTIGDQFVRGQKNVTITLDGLVTGQGYRVQVFGAGSASSGSCLATFSSGNDSIEVDEGLYGAAQGIRTEYLFTADAATRVIRVQSHDPNNTYRLYGIALDKTGPVFSVEEVNGGSAQVIPSGGSFDFGFVALPLHSVTKNFLLRNSGAGGLVVISVLGPFGSPLRFSMQPQSFDLNGTLATGQAVPFQVTYDPGSGGPAQDLLRFYMGGSQFIDFTLKGDSALSYANWSAGQFPGNPGNAAGTADPDRDGLPNLLEYSLRGDPKAFTSARLGQPSAPNAGMRRLSFPYHPSIVDVTWTLQYSANLSGWTDVYRYQRATGGTALLPGVTGAANAGAQMIDVNVPDGALFQGKGFWRVKAE